ncbi:hypothetical protein [Nocardia sp. NBC_01388]|uniref:hypothetical protein n=1 Tax=Nocardia sp. NBC_01388 TaxID=2903596 RepID=UPI00324C3CAE
MTTGPLVESGALPALGRESTRELVRELLNAATSGHTGLLRVSGEPGGDLHFRLGHIVTVDSPGAPGVRELLSRPGRSCAGAADMRVVVLMAALDGAFAITAGWVAGCSWHDLPEPAGQPDTCEPGVEPARLLLETDRRLTALAHGRVSPHRNHLVLTDSGRAVLSGPGSELEAPGSAQRQEILLWVNGRRSCRDIAMLLCRSLYAVTVEVVRMLDADLIGIAAPERAQPPAAETAHSGAARSMLPRRHRGASGINDTLPPRPPQPATRGYQRTAIVRKSERTP